MKTYKKPVLNVEHFVPNEFVAACGDSGTVYKFECNAGDKGLRDYPYKIYKESNGTDGLQTSGRNRDEYLGTYHACGTTHEAESDSGFYKGYMVDTRYDHDSTPTDVIIWTNHDTNIHCTTLLDINKWETSKS